MKINFQKGLKEIKAYKVERLLFQEDLRLINPSSPKREIKLSNKHILLSTSKAAKEKEKTLSPKETQVKPTLYRVKAKWMIRMNNQKANKP